MVRSWCEGGGVMEVGRWVGREVCRGRGGEGSGLCTVRCGAARRVRGRVGRCVTITVYVVYSVFPGVDG